MANFVVGSKYSLSTIAPVTLGSSYNNLTVKALLSFDIAIKFSDVVTTRNKIIQETGANLLDPRLVQYILFSTADDKDLILARDWIIESSVIEVNDIDIVVTIKNVTTNDLTIINNTLQALGYHDITIETTPVGN